MIITNSEQLTDNNSSKKWLVLIGVGMASFLGNLDFTIVNTALPAIKNTFSANVVELQWIINICALALSACMAVAGRMADIYGRKRILFIGLILFAVSSTLAGAAPTIQWLIFWRLIQGIACAILYTSSGAIVSNVFPLEQRGKAMGIFFGIAFTGLAAGPVVGGLIVGSFGWRWIFLINTPIIIISLIICAISIPNKEHNQPGKIDYLGTIMLITGISLLITGISEVNFAGIFALRVWLSLISSVVILVSLYFVEKKTLSPIIQFKLFSNHKFNAGSIANFFLAFFYCLDFFLMPLYLEIIKHQSAYMIGLILLPTSLMVAIVSPIIGKIVDRKGPQKVIFVGFSLFAISALLQICLNNTSSIFFIIIAFSLMGCAWGLLVGPSSLIAINAVSNDEKGSAIGASWTLHNIGGSIGLSLGTAIYHWQFTKNGNSFIAGYHGAMWLLVLSSLFAIAILHVLLKKTTAMA